MNNDPAKSLREIEKKLDEIGKSASDAAAMQAVDLLTDDEVDELRRLAELGDGAAGYAASRLEDGALRGMYLQLSDLGFIHCTGTFGGSVVYTGHTPKADWAIARHDRLAEAKRAEKAEAARQRRFDRLLTFLHILLGFVLGIASALIVAYVTAQAIGAGVPMAV